MPLGGVWTRSFAHLDVTLGSDENGRRQRRSRGSEEGLHKKLRFCPSTSRCGHGCPSTSRCGHGCPSTSRGGHGDGDVGLVVRGRGRGLGRARGRFCGGLALCADGARSEEADGLDEKPQPVDADAAGEEDPVVEDKDEPAKPETETEKK